MTTPSMPLREALQVALEALNEAAATPEHEAARLTLQGHLANKPVAVLAVKVGRTPRTYSGISIEASIAAFRADVEERIARGKRPNLSFRDTTMTSYKFEWRGQEQADLCLDRAREPVMHMQLCGPYLQVLDAFCERLKMTGRHWQRRP